MNPLEGDKMTYVAHLLASKTFTTKLVRGSAYLAFVCALSACAIGKDSNLAGACAGASSEAVAAYANAFASTLQPVVMRASCNSCHDGSGKAPYSFAAGDPTSGVAAALKLANLDTPSDSRFVSKVGQELHNCGNDSSRCQSIANEMKSQIEAWAEATKDIEKPRCDLPGIKLTSTAKRVVPGDLALNTSKVYTFQLDGAVAGVGMLGFSIEARLFQAPTGGNSGLYILRGPMVATGEKKLKIGTINVVVNGKMDPDYANFGRIDYVIDPAPFDINASSWSFPWLTDATQLIAWESPSGDDISFEVYVSTTEEPADLANNDYACHERTLFTNTVWPLFNKTYANNFSGTCVSCHANPANSASTAFNLLVSADQCAESVKKSNFSSPTSSLLLRKARDEANGHPGNNPFSGQTADINAIINWVQAEANAR